MNITQPQLLRILRPAPPNPTPARIFCAIATSTLLLWTLLILAALII